MDSLILCDGGCQSTFNYTTGIPKLLPKCGHTFCLRCIKQLKAGQAAAAGGFQCPQCGTRQVVDNPESLLTNEKVLKIVEIVHKNQEEFNIQNSHNPQLTTED